VKLWQVFDTDGVTHWCATQQEARKLKTKLATGTGIRRGDIVVQPIEVPTRTREDLCKWLNDKEPEPPEQPVGQG